MEMPPEPEKPAKNDNKELVKGMLWVLAGHGVIFGLVLLSMVLTMIAEGAPERILIELATTLPALFFSLPILAMVQWVYVLPLIIIFGVKKQYGMLKGTVLAAGVTILLGLGAFGLCVGLLAT